MPYELSRQIELRLEKVLSLLERGAYSTPGLADEIGVSVPTISRCIAALRERGVKITAVREGNGWHYRVDRGSRPHAPTKMNEKRHRQHGSKKI